MGPTKYSVVDPGAQIIYWNAQAIGALTVVLLAGLVGAFLFTIRPAKVATRMLAVVFAFVALLNVGYVVGQSVFHPAGAWHRLITIFSVNVVIPFFIAFILNFGGDAHARLTRWVLIVGTAIPFAMAFAFGILAYQAGATYDFTAVSWDFESRAPNVAIAVVIAFGVLAFLGFAVLRASELDRRNRYVLLSMALSFLAASLVPSITNILSRSGQIPRGAHQTLAAGCFMIGLFLIIIIYINTTTERTTFMAKIVGVSVVTYLLLFQFISMFALEDQERAYDGARNRDVSLQLAKRRTRQAIQYIDRHDFGATAEDEREIGAALTRAPRGPIGTAEARNALAYERMRARIRAR